MNREEFIIHLLEIKAISTERKAKPMAKRMLEKHPTTLAELISRTSFLPPDVEYKVRLQFYCEGIECSPVCKTCNQPVPLNKFPYIPIFCSKLCVDWKLITEKSKVTNLERYGVDNPAKSEDIQKKREQCMMERYGVAHPAQNQDVLDKIKNTNLERYGVEFSCMADEIKDKRKQTNLERYGGNNPLIHEEIRDKRKITMLDRYGVEYPIQHPLIEQQISDTMMERYGVKRAIQHEPFKNMIQQTNLERYGHINPLKNETVSDKAKQTMLDRYGVEKPYQSANLREKAKQTMLERYGFEYGLNSPIIKHKTKQTMLDRYGVEYPLLSKTIQMKIKQTMLDRYGVEYPLQSGTIRSKGKKTILERYGVEVYSQKHIPLQTLINLNDRNWLINEHMTLQKSLVQITKENGISISMLSCKFKHFGIQVHNFGSSSMPEKEVGEYISHQLGIPIITNDRALIRPLELDIVVPSHSIAIEFDGIYWHGEQQGKGRLYHADKTSKSTNRGIRLIHLFETEWTLKPEIVKSRINSILRKNIKIGARSCLIVQLSQHEAKRFFEEPHIQGSVNCKFVYGLIHNEKLVAAMSFGKSRYSKNHQYELLRYATMLNTNIAGGASKLLKHFVKLHNPKSIVTYSDKRWNTGNLYSSLGFTHTHDSSPSYYYFHKSDTSTLYHRTKFQKHMLKSKLSVYDKSLTEYENMCANGYDRIWDCGTSVWEWRE